MQNSKLNLIHSILNHKNLFKPQPKTGNNYSDPITPNMLADNYLFNYYYGLNSGDLEHILNQLNNI
tara:strand:+ start:5290 stop:5487 length:198 start_codon:yes stop_codon:yes gene_type:complete